MEKVTFIITNKKGNEFYSEKITVIAESQEAAANAIHTDNPNAHSITMAAGVRVQV